jgi:hypothetical protein
VGTTAPSEYVEKEEDEKGTSYWAGRTVQRANGDHAEGMGGCDYVLEVKSRHVFCF